MMPGKALLISDDLETAQIWDYILGQKGIEATLMTPTDDDSTGQRLEYIHDLIIIDAHSSQMNMISLIRHLRADVNIPILLFVSEANEMLTLDAYESGADEVITKPISPRLFLAKINAWMRRSWTVPTALLDSFQVGDLRLDPQQRQLVKADSTSLSLTSLEFRLLHLLMSHPGQVLESSLITDRVWGISGGGDSNLLKNVVYRLRRKIEPDPSQPRYIQSVAGVGYMFRAEQ